MICKNIFKIVPAQLIRKLLNDGFRTILPPKTAVNSNKMITNEKILEKAFQNCLKHFPSPKNMEEMNFWKKTEPKLKQ